MKTEDTFVKSLRPSEDEGEAPPVLLMTPENMLSLLIDAAKTFDVGLEEEVYDEERAGDGPGIPLGSEESACNALIAVLRQLNEEQRIEVLALLWVGRGDYDLNGWNDALTAARDANEDRDIIDYLVGTPLLSDYLQEGLAELGHDLSDISSTV